MDMSVDRKTAESSLPPLLPSQLKQILKQKRKAKGPDQTSCFNSHKTLRSKRTPLAPLSRQDLEQQIVARADKSEYLNWAILSRLTISCPHNVFPKTAANLFCYYQYPFPSICVSQQKNWIAKILRSTKKESPERDYFRKIVDGWRSSFLSAYEALKEGEMSFFYYMQEDLCVLFKNNLQAIVCSKSAPFTESLKSEGIVLSEDIPNLAEHQEDLILNQENIKPHDQSTTGIKESIQNRINNRLNQRSKRRSAAFDLFKIDGKTDISLLVDFIINQKDGKSFVILPEIVAPKPFLHSAQGRCKQKIAGPLLDGSFNLEISGRIMAPLSKYILKEHVVEVNRITCEPEPLTKDLVKIKNI